jgi:hypothetical protein
MRDVLAARPDVCFAALPLYKRPNQPKRPSMSRVLEPLRWAGWDGWDVAGDRRGAIDVARFKRSDHSSEEEGQSA